MFDARIDSPQVQLSEGSRVPPEHPHNIDESVFTPFKLFLEVKCLCLGRFYLGFEMLFCYFTSDFFYLLSQISSLVQ